MRVFASIEPMYVAPADPFGPSASAYSGGDTFAPASRAIARSTSALTELSANTAGTCSRRIVRTSSAVSPADACPRVERDGITVAITSRP